MTRQVLAHQPHTVSFRSREGGALIDTPLTVEGTIYSDPDCKDRINKADRVTNGAGEFTFYAKPGTVVTLAADSPIAEETEPVQFVGVGPRPGGLAAVHPDDTPDVHETSPVSQLVSDASLVGAPPFRLPEEEGGALAAVGVATATAEPPGEPSDVPTPDGTTATDPDAVKPAAVNTEQETPQYEPVPEDGTTRMQPSEPVE